MTTLIDSLVVSVGLDPTPFQKGTQEVQKSLKTTADSASRYGRQMESDGARAAQYFSKIKIEALGLAGVFLGTAGIGAVVKNLSGSVAELGRSAVNIGVALPALDAFRSAIARNGGDAQAATASLQGYANAIERFKLQGDASVLQYLSPLGASVSDDPLEVYKKFQKYVENHKNQKDGAQLINFEGAGLGYDQGTINAAIQMGSVARFNAELERSRQLGVISKQTADDMARISGAFAGLEQATTKLGASVLDVLTPSIVFLLNAISNLISANPVLSSALAATVAVKTPAAIRAGLRYFTGLGGEAATAEAATAEAVAGGGILGTAGVLVAGALAIPEALHIGGLNNGETLPNGPQGVTLPSYKPLSSAETEARKNQAFDFFKSQGWGDVHAAALAGNIQGESGFNETQIGDKDTGGAFGIGQWHMPRVNEILKGTGIDVRSAPYAQQLQAMQWELLHTEGASAVALGDAKDTGGSESALVSKYERSKNQVSDIAKRTGYANSILASRSVTPSSAPASTTNTTTVGTVVVNTKATDAKGIANDIHGALVTQGNRGLS